MLNKIIKPLVVALGTAGVSGAALAGLSAVDPGPYTAGSGYFPVWYDDGTTNLEYCHSRALSSRVAGNYMCNLIPNPPIFNDTLPDVFTANWPDEAFYFSAAAAIDAGSVPNAQNTCVSYGADVEAAFGTGIPTANDQITFSRIRIRANVPVTGTYTITHPYGVETAQATTASGGAGACNGNQTDISITRDIGIGGAGNYSGVLIGDVGPYLTDPNGPYTETNPATGALETFIGDPNLTTNVTIGGVATAVTGVPVTGGPNGNVVRIQGPGGIDVQTDLFALSGKLYGGELPVAVNVDRSTYRRTTADGTHLEVFASAPAAATVTYRESVPTGTENPMTGDADHWYGTNTNLPGLVVVTASAAGNTPSSMDSQVTDLVKITMATYDRNTGNLVVEASSSDEVSVPTLTAAGIGALTPLSIPPTQQLASNLSEAVANITVQSSSGGSDTEPLHVTCSDCDDDGVPDISDNCPVTANPGQEDVDGDGVGDACDNCTQVANGPTIPDAGGNSQRDTDGDGYGNMCDADLDQNGTTNVFDFGRFRVAYGTADSNSDFNGDGSVNVFDYGIFRTLYGKVPGPSCRGIPLP